jgi:hypothetical protein
MRRSTPATRNRASTGYASCRATNRYCGCFAAVGFARVERIAPPVGAYEQMRSGKRVMVVAYVD